MAVGDVNYCFTVIDLGQYGSNNDSGVLASSVMGEMFDNGEINLPAPSKIYQSSDQDLPYFLLGDEIFPLKDWLMRSFPGTGAIEEEKIYNYRHSRACRCIGNAFGILSQLRRIFLKPIKASVKNRKLHIGMFGPTELLTPNRKCKVHSSRFCRFRR